MKNITISVDEEVAEWARVFAARQGGSVSRIVGELLRARMLQEEGYARAMSDWMSCPPSPLKRNGGYPTRDDLHER